MYGRKKTAFRKFLHPIFAFSAQANSRLRTFTSIVAHIANLNVNKYEYPTFLS